MDEDAKLECDLLKINKDIALWSHWNLKMFVWWGTISQLWEAISSFAFKCITFKIGNFSNMTGLGYKKHSDQEVF